MKRFLKKTFAVCLALALVCACAPAAMAGRPYAAKDVVQFGSYPQAEVTDETLIAQLAAAEKEWHSYEYYSGHYSDRIDFGTMKPSDYMRYADFAYAGVRYRAVQGSRPYSSLHKATVLSEEGMEKSTKYYVYAPLEWIVVDPDSGWLICSEIIDAQTFCNEIYRKVVYDPNYLDVYYNGVGENPSNYGTSSVREWLNEAFWDSAFNESEKSFVADTTFPDTGSKNEEVEMLSDKVFLCSKEEAADTLTGIVKMTYLTCTSYAKSQGAIFYENVNTTSGLVYNAGSAWWLRTPFGQQGADLIHAWGTTNNSYNSNTVSRESSGVYNVRGIRPSIHLTNIDQALHDHSFTPSVTKAATCTEAGERTFLCSGCGYSYTETIPASGKTAYAVSDTVQFGEYPQTQVTDSELLSALDALEKDWKSYGYYVGKRAFGTMKPSDFMQYADVEYAGARYRAVTFSAYRPYATTYANPEYGYANFGGFAPDTTYYFRYEPLEWIVLDPDTGYLIAKNILDAQTYSDAVSYTAANGMTDAHYNVAGEFASDYATSSLRAWLNGTFWGTAFSEDEQAFIVDSMIANRIYAGNEEYTADTLTDKVFIWSQQDAENTSLSSAAGMYRLSVTGYAQCQGAVQFTQTGGTSSTPYQHGSEWWLRTPFYSKSASVVTGYDGTVYQGFGSAADISANATEVYGVRGVRPAIHLTDIPAAAHAQTYTSAVTKVPSCTEDGEKTFTCSVCGDSYTEKIEAPGHTLEHKTEPATCTADGSEYDLCTVCGVKLNEQTISAPGHKYDSAVTKDAMCTEDGERTFTCTICGDSYTEPIEAPGHTTEHNTEPATCTEAGAEYDLCTVCSAKLNETTIPAAGHKYDSEVTKDATCTENGERTFTCSVCGDSYTEKIEATGHKLEHKTEPATCTEAGAEYDLCTVCGAKLNEQTISAPGHKYDSAVTKDATCTENGEKTFTCSVCGDSYTEEIKAAGHTTEHNTEPATCTADGSEYDLCTVCSAKLNETTIPAAGHKYDSEVTKDATCTENGERTFTCSVCGDSYTEKIEAPGHTLVHKTEPAACTKDGTEYDQCSVCGTKLNETTVPAPGHKYDSAVTKDATCTEDGEKTFTCSVCSDSYTEKIEAPGHKLEHKTEPATCTADGSEYDLCTVCSAKLNEVTIPAEGHKYDSAVTKDVTCTEDGERTFTCSVCGDSYTEKIEAPGHTTEHKMEPATCTEDGKEYDLCTVCGERFNEKTIPAAGHKYDVTVKDATCTADGERTFTCTVCGDSYTEKIEATGHKLEHKTDAATCTEAGAEYDLCTVCGKYFNVKPLPAAGHHFVNGVCTECGATHFWEYTVQNGGAQITAYHGDAAWLEIPSVIDGYLVTSIGAAAFAENKDLEFVFVPDSVTYIAAYAFADCVALQEICVGAHVARIDAGAFAHCPSLAIVSFFGGNLTLRTGLFADADERLMIVAPADSQTEKTARSDGLHCVGYTYPLEKDGKHVLAFNGETTLYADLDYGYWTEFVARYADIYYLYFESLTFDGISPSILKGQDGAEAFVDMDAENLTMESVYISVEVNGEQVTFQRLVEMLENGETSLAVTFDNGAGKKLTIWQKIGAAMIKVFNALTKLVRAIVRIFKK